MSLKLTSDYFKSSPAFPLVPTPPIQINGQSSSYFNLAPLPPSNSFIDSNLVPHPSYSIPLPFLVFSEKLELISINDSALRLFGSEAVIGKSIRWFLCEDSNSTASSSILEAEEIDNLTIQMSKFANHMASNTSRCWDEGLPLDYFTRDATLVKLRTRFRAEVMIQSFPSPKNVDYTPMETPPVSASIFNSIGNNNTNSFSILFVRDLPIIDRRNHSLLSSRAPSPSSLRTTSSLGVQSSTTSSSNPNHAAITPITPHRQTIKPLPPAIAQLYKTPTAQDDLDAMDISEEENEDKKCKLYEESEISQYFVGDLEQPSTDYYKNIVENLPLIVWTAGKDGVVNYFNERWYDYTGISRNSNVLDANTWIHSFHAEDMQQAVGKWTHSVNTGEPYHSEYRVRGSDGIWRWMVAKGTCLRDESGAIVRWTTSIVEIQELVSTKNEAIRIKKSISAVLLGADIVLLSVDRSSIITLFEGSASAALAVGFKSVYPDSDCIGQKLDTVWPDARLGLAVEKILDENMDNASWVLETEAEQEGGMVHNKHCYRYRLVPLKSESKHDFGSVTGVIIVVADVTQLAIAEEDLKVSKIAQQDSMASETAANEASRLKTEFVTNISHEIRTPIAIIIGNCEVLLDEKTLTQSQRVLIYKTFRSAEILLDLVGMVLDMGKVESGKLIIEHRPFLLSDVLDDANLFAVLAKKQGIFFEENIGEHYSGPLIGDRVRIRQVIANGLSNAIKFTAKEGNIKVEMRQELESDSHCVFVFTIKDTGIGIEAHVLPTLFVPFQQADTSTARKYGGTGLGLVIARKLAESMGGTVVLDSTPDLGSTFSFRLPLDKAPSIAAPRVRRTSIDDIASPSTFSILLPVDSHNGTNFDPSVEVVYDSWEGVKILVAEDNELILDIVTRILTKKNFDVTAVSDGAAAVKAVEENDFDLILMDGQMPLLDGYEATAKIRSLSDLVKRRVKIIALTASAFTGDRDRCLRAGMDGYLAKPVRSTTLEAAIFDHLRGSSRNSLRHEPDVIIM